MKTIKLIIGIVFLIIAYSISLCYLSYKIGYATARDEAKAKINMDKKTLDNHGKILKTIYSESDSAVSARLKKNIGTN